jgi:hypothetical protein
MPTLTIPQHGVSRPIAAPAGERRRRVALVACDGPEGGVRRRARTAQALAAVLEEAGMSALVGSEGNVRDADLVVCDVIRPDRDLPAEVALAALHGVPVVALMPAAVRIEGLAAELLAGARIVRYDGRPSHQALHRALLG